MRMFTLIAAGAAALALAAPAAATTTITTDDTWTVTDTDGDTTAAVIVTPANRPASWGNAVPGTDWISNNPTGRNTTPGLYTFTKFFDLIDASSYSLLTAVWKSDNFISDILLNGKSLNSGGDFPDFNQFGNVGPFTKTFDLTAVGASFVDGENLLEVVVRQRDLGNNSGNDMGLSGRFIVASVPEPGTWMLMILGLGAVGFAMRRRQKTVVSLQFA